MSLSVWGTRTHPLFHCNVLCDSRFIYFKYFFTIRGEGLESWVESLQCNNYSKLIAREISALSVGMLILMRLYPISLCRTYKSTTFFLHTTWQTIQRKRKFLRKKLMNIKKIIINCTKYMAEWVQINNKKYIWTN